MAKYIYGIINSKKIAAGEEIHAIPYQDISAVVSDSEIIDYRYLSKEALARQLIKHQQVIEEIMRGTTIIPMRLGTFAVDEAEVKDILEKGYSLIKEIFPKVKDKIEIDVCVTWCDFGTSIKEAGEEREVKEAKEKLLANPKGITVEESVTFLR
ncbi:GvpL/GvpF family gas vesicle protein [bacterium]|nr:GvpL/GvpF family gas vesicle protein [bacterium]